MVRLTTAREHGFVDSSTTDEQINDYAAKVGYSAQASNIVQNPPTGEAMAFLARQVKKAEHRKGPTYTEKYGDLRNLAAKQRGDNTGLVGAETLHGVAVEASGVGASEARAVASASEARAVALDTGAARAGAVVDLDGVEVVDPKTQCLRKRVRKRAVKKFLDKKTTPRTKEKAAKLHRRLAAGDESLSSFLDVIEEDNEQAGSQEAMEGCFDYMKHSG